MREMRNNLLVRGLFLVLVLTTLTVTLLPFLWMIGTAFDCPYIETADVPNPMGKPNGWSFRAFRELGAIFQVGPPMLNSLIYATGFTLFSLLFNSLAAYAFARIAFPRRDQIFTLLVLTMMIPSQVTLIPVYLILKEMGLLNTYLGLILPGCSHVMGIFMVRQYIRDLPDELFEAARMDGCSEIWIFWYIVLPLARPVLATLAITSFIGAWNEFLLPLVIMQDDRGYPLPVALAAMNSQYDGTANMRMAAALIAALPAIVLFLLAQRHYLRGLTAGVGK
jgi:multiple sugar transport system permease protein